MQHDTAGSNGPEGAPRTPEHALYYTDDLIENLQLRWGDGFMSPGGKAELAHMLGPVRVAGAHVLDFGCGIGGYDMALVEDHGAARVTGIDIDAASLAQARRRAAAQGLQERLDFVLVDGLPLPFADAAFDLILSKDAIVDVRDKAAVLGDLYRVLRPGGALVFGDWFRSEGPMTPEMREWCTEGDETYDMATIAEASEWVRAAGFHGIEAEDRNAWFRDLARDEYDRLRGPLHATYVARFGVEQADRSVETARIRACLADQGQLRPGHIRARKPV